MYKIYNIDSDFGESCPQYAETKIEAELIRNEYIKYVYDEFLEYAIDYEKEDLTEEEEKERHNQLLKKAIEAIIIEKV